MNEIRLESVSRCGQPSPYSSTCWRPGETFIKYQPAQALNVSSYIANEFVLINFLGNSYNKKTYCELADKGLFGNIKNYEKQSVSSGQFKYELGNYKVFGFVAVGDKNDKWQAFDFENTYRYTNKSWFLTEIKLTKPSGF